MSDNTINDDTIDDALAQIKEKWQLDILDDEKIDPETGETILSIDINAYTQHFVNSLYPDAIDDVQAVTMYVLDAMQAAIDAAGDGEAMHDDTE